MVRHYRISTQELWDRKKHLYPYHATTIRAGTKAIKATDVKEEQFGPFLSCPGNHRTQWGFQTQDARDRFCIVYGAKKLLT